MGLAIATPILTPIALVACKTWFTAWITKGMEHKFDVKLENLKSDLRQNEAEIDALRNNVLSASTGRQTLLDKRRFEAVEKIWTAINDFGPAKGLSQMMALLNIEILSTNTLDPRVQALLKGMDTVVALNPETAKNIARDESLFVSEIAWAYFQAYCNVVYFNLWRFATLKSGIENPQKLMNADVIKKVLKAALPHQTKFIDECDPNAYYYLLEEIEEALLNELRKILDGKETDRSSVQRGKEIMDAIKMADGA